MLSRVAENLYWMARYLERAENTARLINVNTNLLLDLPRSVQPGWRPLIELTGSGEIYVQDNTEFDERSVVKFLIADTGNPGSLVVSLQQARENGRTVRDFVPREAWEQVNELFIYAKGHVVSGLGQRRRFEYLREIINGVQHITGLLAGTMLHDHGYDFIRMGRNLERSDMSVRIIDVRSANLLPKASDELSPFENIQWMSVLRSLSGYQMYRRSMQVRVRRHEVLQFLFHNEQFPRALRHSLGEVEICLNNLPRNRNALACVNKLKKLIADGKPEDLDQQDLHRFIDDIELELIGLHETIAETYFLHAN